MVLYFTHIYFVLIILTSVLYFGYCRQGPFLRWSCSKIVGLIIFSVIIIGSIDRASYSQEVLYFSISYILGLLSLL